MKGSDEHYSIIVFRGARSNPLRLKLRRTVVQRSLIIGGLILLIQAGILTHYIIQTTQLIELYGIEEELSSSLQRTNSFSVEIDGMKKRMLALELLNRKLQTMFGLEPDEMEGISKSMLGQGGEEFPFEIPSANGDDLNTSDFSNDGLASNKSAPTSNNNELVANNIEQGLQWLNHQVTIEQKILDDLSTTADERAERWASTPSIWPVNGHITSKFGRRVSPFTGKKALHAGIDIGAPKGEEIRAPAGGRVVVAAYDARMGNFIRIDHGFGIETTYGHLSKMLVKYKQRVRRGDVIGLVGSTGRFSTGPHLHYQVAVNDRVVNPVQYILD